MKKTECNKAIKELEHDMRLGKEVLRRIPQIVKSKRSNMEKDKAINEVIKKFSKHRKLKHNQYRPSIKKVEKCDLTSEMKKRMKKIKEFY